MQMTRIITQSSEFWYGKLYQLSLTKSDRELAGHERTIPGSLHQPA